MGNKNVTDINEMEYLYDFIENFAEERNLIKTLHALKLMKKLVKANEINVVKFEHCMMVCRMMIDLNMSLTIDEDDILLASALCHIVPEEKKITDPIALLEEDKYLKNEVIDIVKLLNTIDGVEDMELQSGLEKVQTNKLAFMIAITDRGNVIEQLYVMNSWQVRRFIYETRRYYFPMCIFGKEHYHELLAPINILLEKLRNLADVSETLLYKFEVREIELSQEIIALKEENATIRGILQKLKNK